VVLTQARVTWTFERRLLGAAVLAWAIVATMNLLACPALGHDEAAFATIARGDDQIWLYRSRGVVALARLGLALGGTDLQLRIASAILGLGVLKLALHKARGTPLPEEWGTSSRDLVLE
jgi:hypothetical protein